MQQTQIFSVLDIPIHSYALANLETELRAGLNNPTFEQIATVNPEFLVASQSDKKFRQLLQHNTWLNLCDGFGIKAINKLLYNRNIERITGVDTALLLCKICEQEKKSVYLLGGIGVAKQASIILRGKFPDLNVVGHEDGHPDQISQKLLAAKPDVIFVAFGAPKQEFWLQEFGTKSGACIGIGVGGTFDFLAGKRIRAPRFFRILGLEWLWRLIQEPHRWRRITNAVIVFPWLMLLEKIRNKR